MGFDLEIKRMIDPAPALTAVLTGTNDLPQEMSGGHSAAVDIVRSVIELHKASHREGVPIVAISVPTSGGQKAVPEAADLAAEVNRELKSWSDTVGPNAQFVEFPFGKTVKDNPQWAGDELHFAPRGYQELGEGLADDIWKISNAE